MILVFAGVVMAAGGKGQIISALMNVQVIRQHLRSRLPVEIFYAAEAEMPSYMRLLPGLCQRQRYQHIRRTNNTNTWWLPASGH